MFFHFNFKRMFLYFGKWWQDFMANYRYRHITLVLRHDTTHTFSPSAEKGGSNVFMCRTLTFHFVQLIVPPCAVTLNWTPFFPVLLPTAHIHTTLQCHHSKSDFLHLIPGLALIVFQRRLFWIRPLSLTKYSVHCFCACSHKTPPSPQQKWNCLSSIIPASCQDLSAAPPIPRPPRPLGQQPSARLAVRSARWLLLSHLRSFVPATPACRSLSSLYLNFMYLRPGPKVCSINLSLKKLPKIPPLTLYQKHILRHVCLVVNHPLSYFAVVYTHHFLLDCMRFVGKDCVWPLFAPPYCLLQCFHIIRAL